MTQIKNQSYYKQNKNRGGIPLQLAAPTHLNLPLISYHKSASYNC